MSKRSREISKKPIVDDPLFDSDDSSDEDYQPSDEEENDRVNPNQSFRERISLPDHLTNVVKEKDLNKIHLGIITSTDLEANDDKIEWKKEKSVLLKQGTTIVESDSGVNERRLVRTYVTHISSFSDGSSSSNENSKKDQVLLGISCWSKGALDLLLKFSIDGEKLDEMETLVLHGQPLYVHGYDDLMRKLRQKLLINAYVPPPQSSRSSNNNQSAQASSSSSSSSETENEFGIIKIEVYKANKRRIEKEDHSDSEDTTDEEEDVIDPIIGKLSKVTSQDEAPQSNMQVKRCGMQVSYRATKIQRPKKKAKRRGNKSNTEIRFECGTHLFDSVYKYRNYLGYLCELSEHNIDLKKVSNTARGRGISNSDEEDDEEVSSDEEDESDSVKVKKEEEDVIVDITEDEPEKVIPTVSLESDNEEDSKEDIKVTPSEMLKLYSQNTTPQQPSSNNNCGPRPPTITSSSTTTSTATHSSDYTFTDKSLHEKSVEDLRLFLKLNDEELYTSIRNLLNKHQISGTKFMSLTPLDFNQMGVGVKDQIKILQITKRIHDNSKL